MPVGRLAPRRATIVWGEMGAALKLLDFGPGGVDEILADDPLPQPALPALPPLPGANGWGGGGGGGWQQGGGAPMQQMQGGPMGGGWQQGGMPPMGRGGGGPPMQPGMMPMQQPGMMGRGGGMMPMQPGMMPMQPGMMPMQPGMMPLPGMAPPPLQQPRGPLDAALDESLPQHSFAAQRQGGGPGPGGAGGGRPVSGPPRY